MTDSQTPLTYAAAGVDIDARDHVASELGRIAGSTHGPRVMGRSGGFAGMFRLGEGYRDPVLVSTTDGVGTKLTLGRIMGRYRSIGRDLVHANVNDLLTVGAEPLFFLDYLATTELANEHRLALVEGMAEACREGGIALIGGETADMPDIYQHGDFDLAGFVVGVVERDAIIDGSGIEAGTSLIALPSTGLHTNGYSLVRQVWGLGKGLGDDRDRTLLEETHEALGGTLADALLEPHPSYAAAVQAAREHVLGICHVTGGGLPGNVPRMLPEGLAAVIDRSSWSVPPLFELIASAGNIELAEMFRTFNMGIGLLLAVHPDNVEEVMATLPDDAWIAGDVRTHEGGTLVQGLE